MTRSVAQSVSLWLASSDLPTFAPLRQDLQVDVCIVGAGMAGLSTAYLLAKEGRRVAIVTQEGVGEGETMRTSAHLTAALDTRYFRLEAPWRAGARLAAASHTRAIDRIEHIVARNASTAPLRDSTAIWWPPASKRPGRSIGNGRPPVRRHRGRKTPPLSRGSFFAWAVPAVSPASRVPSAGVPGGPGAGRRRDGRSHLYRYARRHRNRSGAGPGADIRRARDHGRGSRNCHRHPGQHGFDSPHQAGRVPHLRDCRGARRALPAALSGIRTPPITMFARTRWSNRIGPRICSSSEAKITRPARPTIPSIATTGWKPGCGPAFPWPGRSTIAGRGRSWSRMTAWPLWGIRAMKRSFWPRALRGTD